MILSMLAVQPYWLVTIQQGETTRRFEITTFSTFLSRMSFITCKSGVRFARIKNYKEFHLAEAGELLFISFGLLLFLLVFRKL